MSLMATSRPDFRCNKVVAKTFPAHRRLEIRQNEDIEAYLTAQMHTLPDVVMRDIDLQDS